MLHFVLVIIIILLVVTLLKKTDGYSILFSTYVLISLAIRIFTHIQMCYDSL